MRLISCLCIVLCLLSCSSENTPTNQNPIHFVPSSSLLVFESQNLTNTSSLLTENSFLKANQSFPLVNKIKNRIQFFESFNSSKSGVLCFSAVGKKDIATTFITSSRDIDFQLIKDGLVQQEQLTYEGKEIYVFTWNGKQLFAVWFNEILFVSDFKLIVENKIRDQANLLPLDTRFSKVLKTVDASYPSLYINVEEFKRIYQKGFSKESYGIFNNFTDWVALDLKVEANQLRFTGVSISEIENNRKLNLLAGQDRIEHTIDKLVPLNALGFESYSITDFSKFNVLRKKQGLVKLSNHLDVFEQIQAVGKIHFADEEVVVFKSKLTESLAKKLQTFLRSNTNFRGFELFELEGINLTEPYKPLIGAKPLKYITQIGELFVLAPSIDILEQIIISRENELTLHNQNSYQTQMADLSDASNALIYAITTNWLENLQKQSKDESTENLSKIELTKYEGLVLQLNIDNEFAYVNAIFEAVENNKNEVNVQQKSRFKLANKSLTSPQFFTNWRTKQRDVFVQDQNLDIYLVDSEGKTIWNKKLDDVVLGKIEAFDIYKNTRIQMAFATSNKVHVFDKNGERVSPFPIEFINPITQALQIFDYDNNGNYRLMVCQGKLLKAFDKGGNLVEGFSFSTKNTNISAPPKHFRLGKKDYILVQEEDGKLHILDRRGDVRVNYTTNIQFSGQPWYVYDGKFTSTTKDGDIVQISEKGDVSILERDLAQTHHLVANQRLLVTFSENKLRINEVGIELNYGFYSSPQILQHQDKTWVSITDRQAKKLYVFDEFGNSIPGFPVFGTSAVDYFATASNTLQIMVEGEDQAILIYEIE